MTMSTLGIDLSLSSPSLCIHQSGGFNLNTCIFYYITNVKKTVSSSNNLNGELWPQYHTDEQRYDIVSTWILDKIKKHGVTNIFLEGYAFNAVGRVFQIAENTGILKHKIWQQNIPCTVIPPTVIKKFATGKGNANKEKLNDVFEQETGFNLKAHLQLTPKQWNPSSDIIDSYFICKYGVLNG